MPTATQTKVIATISQEGLSKILKYSRMYSYLMTSFTKTYVVFADDEATFYFKGNKSLLSISAKLESSIAENHRISVDIQKFLSAAKKIARGDLLNLTFSTAPPTLMLSSNISNDKITLGVQYFEEDNSEVSELVSFYETAEPRFEEGTTINVTQELLDFIHITSTYMSTINKNNSIAIHHDKLRYADRTIILNSTTKVIDTVLAEPILMHRFILNFIEFVAPENPSFIVDSDKKTVLWKSSEDDSFWAVLAIDPCNIALPEDSDVAMFIPEASNQQMVTLTPGAFEEAIDFFNGLFEASVWKPITFFWNGDNNGEQTIKLSYHHPSTEVEKMLTCEEFTGNLTNNTLTASFILISDSIRTLLSRFESDGMIELTFNGEEPTDAHGAGVHLIYKDAKGNELYDAVLVKLQDT